MKEFGFNFEMTELFSHLPNYTEDDEEQFTYIKCSLNRMCSDDILKERIITACKEMSDIIVNAGNYIFYKLRKDFDERKFPKCKTDINFESLFHAANLTSTRCNIDEHYKRLQ